MKVKIKNILNKSLVKKTSQVLLVLLVLFLINGTSIKNFSTIKNNTPEIKYNSDIAVELSTVDEENNKNTVELFLENNEEQLRFYSRIFNMNYEDVIIKIREINSNILEINENNIARVSDLEGNIYTYPSIDRGILEMFLYLENTYPEMVENTYEPYSGNVEYIEALIEYFSSLYPNVDHKMMLSIGAAESGYYTSANMLAKNNIYGGMGSNGLITYKNIEYGIMQYIKKMAESYYDKGLNTVESIGYVFCPKQVNGIKVVSPHWLNLVNKALNDYTFELRYVTIAQLNDLASKEI